MTFEGIILLFLIAAICGALGQAIAGFNAGGCLLSLALGFLGAFVGSVIANALDLPPFLQITIQGERFPIVWAVVGATLVTFVLGVVARTARSSRN